jgi:hypothetical protein
MKLTDLLQRLLAAMEFVRCHAANAPQSKMFSEVNITRIRQLDAIRDELADAVAAGARLVPHNDVKWRHWFPRGIGSCVCGVDVGYCAASADDATCEDCRRILDGEKAAEPAEIVHWWPGERCDIPLACGLDHLPHTWVGDANKHKVTCQACLAAMYALARCDVMTMEAFK